MDAKTVDRKQLVTTLAECSQCFLLFRRPQEPPDFAERFYQSEYQSSLATELPDQAALSQFLEDGFLGSEKDFSEKIAILKCLGVSLGARVLDFGASWGYGVWQLRQAGYAAEGYELSKPRAAYGRERLGVSIHDSLKALQGRNFDVIFTNHVLEHIPQVANVISQIAGLLTDEGAMVAFFPNGSLPCRQANWKRFHNNWGRLHPIYLNDRFLEKTFHRRPMLLFSKRYDQSVALNLVDSWDRDSTKIEDLRENELCCIAYPNRETGASAIRGEK